MTFPTAILSLVAAQSLFWESLIISVVIFALVIAGALGLWVSFFPERTAQDRLSEMLSQESNEPTETKIVEEQTEWEQRVSQIGRRLNAGAKEEEIRQLKATLRYAGYRDRHAYEVLNGTRVVFALAGPVLALPLGLVLEPQALLLGMLIAAVLGYYLPYVIVNQKAGTRQHEMTQGLPDALDLLVSCVEAGLGMDQAFRRVAGEMEAIAPQLAREFIMVNSEVTAGIDRIEALKRLYDRTGVEDIRSLVNMLAQADKYGTSIANSLKIFSQVAREKRMARAEEAAGKVGTKITFVMMMFFLPVLGTVLLAPTLINMLSGE